MKVCKHKKFSYENFKIYGTYTHHIYCHIHTHHHSNFTKLVEDREFYSEVG